MKVTERSVVELANDLVSENLFLQGYLEGDLSDKKIRAKLLHHRRKIDRIERQLAARIIFTRAARYEDGAPESIDLISKGVIDALLRGKHPWPGRTG